MIGTVLVLASLSCLSGRPRVSVDGVPSASANAEVELRSDGRVLVTATAPISTVRIEGAKS